MTQKASDPCTTCSPPKMGFPCGCWTCINCGKLHRCIHSRLSYMEIDFNPEVTKIKPVREIKKSNFVPGWAKRMNDEEWEELLRLEDACGGLFAGDPYYDATNGASDIAMDIINNIITSYCEPLEDQSLRDNEIKDAILRHFKKLLREAADELENNGY